MPKFKNTDFAELAHQLSLTPKRLCSKHISGAENLLDLIQPNQEYSYEFVCFHLTGHRPLRSNRKTFFKSKSLVCDLVKLIEQLSQQAAITLASLSQPVYTQDELASHLQVSLKTIARWRMRGLTGIRVLDKKNTNRLVFTDAAVKRFSAANKELVQRGSAFKQLSENDRRQLVKRSRELVSERRLKLSEVVKIIAQETGRPLETVRYTLRRYDQKNPSKAIFSPNGQPRIPDQFAALYRDYRSGLDFSQLANLHNVSINKAQRICLEMNAHELRNRKLALVFHPQFDAVNAKSMILDSPEPTTESVTESDKPRPASDTPAYLAALYEVPLLSFAQEQDLFRRYNFCKYWAQKLINQLDPAMATASAIEEIERYLQRADEFQNRIIKANLRLVVSIAGRHARRGMNLFELVSDGNMSLLRAVERFDFGRGFKFSTYASWAIMKNFARTLSEERGRYARFVTGQEEVLESAPVTSDSVVTPANDREDVRQAIAVGLKQLDQRERLILTSHFGLHSDKDVVTLEQLGEKFGVSKERVRQIEKRALTKLKQVLSPSLADLVAT